MNSDPVPAAVRQARERAELLVAPVAVQRAIDQVAVRLALRLEQTNPLVLVVMHGGLPFAAELLKRFAFPLEFGYLDVGRYGAATRGGVLRWFAEPRFTVAGRTVLVVDDVLDRGETLAAIRGWALDSGADHLITSVLVDKAVAGPRPVAADYAALVCPDRFLFGCGMDYQGYWRNLPGIYALSDALAHG